jgi:hypothetical protein
MRRLSALGFVLALAACSPEQSTGSVAEASVAPAPVQCQATASRDWSAVGSQYYVIEAEASGRTCAEAVATMRVRSTEGAVLFEHVYPVASVPLAFNPHNDQTGLRNDLEGWTQNSAQSATADTLPAWPAGARTPPGFQPIVSRGQYELARGNQGPLFCFPDGAESNACIAMAGASATLLGSWTPEMTAAPEDIAPSE